MNEATLIETCAELIAEAARLLAQSCDLAGHTQTAEQARDIESGMRDSLGHYRLALVAGPQDDPWDAA